ncbi:MAG: hypothetical protein WAM82_30540, partial [Thermoanaerobaculia bacterium]
MSDPRHRLRILHISDLHERGPREKETWRRRRVLGDAWDRNLTELLRASRYRYRGSGKHRRAKVS